MRRISEISNYFNARPGLLVKVAIISFLSWLGFIGIADKIVDFVVWFQVGVLQHWRDLQGLLIGFFYRLFGVELPEILIDYTIVWLSYVRSVSVFRSEFHQSSSALTNERERKFSPKWDWEPPTPGFMEATPRKDYGMHTIGIPNPLSNPLSIFFSYFLFPFTIAVNTILVLISAAFSGFLYEVRLAYGVVFDATVLFWAQVILFIPALFVVSDFAKSLGIL